jgi:hypothetical protein
MGAAFLSHVQFDALLATRFARSHRTTLTPCKGIQVITRKGVSALTNLFLRVRNSALIRAVLHVVLLRTGNEMFWVEARRIITAMADGVLASPNRCAVPDIGGNPMQSNEHAEQIYNPVAAVIGCSLPDPAPTNTVNNYVLLHR